MSKKILAVLGAIAILLVAWVAYALTTQYSGDQTGNVLSGLSITFNDVTIADGDTMEWGDLTINVPKSMTLTVTNNFDTEQEITFLSVDLPGDWTELWEPDETILGPGATATGDLTLTATTLGEFTISWQITATETT